MTKLAVIGIDGLDFNLVEKWIDDLPTLKSLHRSRMESVIPTLSCPAWPCMWTGMTPQELNMYDFVDFKDGRLFDSQDWWEKSIFKKLDDKGVKQVLVNIPFAYPPHKMQNGYVLPGHLGNPKITHLIDISTKGKERQNRGSCMSILAEENDEVENRIGGDLFVACFYPLDPMQHYFWRHMGEDNDEIHIWYRLLNNIVDDLLQRLGDCPVIIVSDHGFGAYKKGFNINRWLEKEGYLTFKKQYSPPLLSRLTPIAKKVPFADKFASFAPQGMKTGGQLRDMVTGLYDAIDWGKTVAYSPSQSSGCIFIRNSADVPLTAYNIRKKLEALEIKVVVGEHGIYPSLLLKHGMNGIYPMNTWGKGIWTTHQGWSGSHTLDGVFMSNCDLKCEKLTDVRKVIEGVL